MDYWMLCFPCLSIDLACTQVDHRSTFSIDMSRESERTLLSGGERRRRLEFTLQSNTRGNLVHLNLLLLARDNQRGPHPPATLAPLPESSGSIEMILSHMLLNSSFETDRPLLSHLADVH